MFLFYYYYFFFTRALTKAISVFLSFRIFFSNKLSRAEDKPCIQKPCVFKMKRLFGVMRMFDKKFKKCKKFDNPVRRAFVKISINT